MFLVVIIWLVAGAYVNGQVIGTAPSYKSCQRQAQKVLDENEGRVEERLEDEEAVPAILCAYLPEYNEDGIEVKNPTTVHL